MPENSRVQFFLIYWNKTRVFYRQETSHSLLPIICKPGLDTSRYLELATTVSPCLSTFSSWSSFTWINPLKASFMLSRTHAPFHCESCLSSNICQVVITVYPDVGFKCFWNHRFVWSTGIKPVNTSLDTNPVTGFGKVC